MNDKQTKLYNAITELADQAEKEDGLSALEQFEVLAQYTHTLKLWSIEEREREVEEIVETVEGN